MVAAVMAAVINGYVYLTRAQEIRRLIVKYITVSRFGLKEKKSWSKIIINAILTIRGFW